MKKGTIIAIVVAVAVVLLIVIVGMTLFVSLNKEKTSITAENFYTTMSQKGYNVQDANSQFSDYDYITQVYIAISEDYSYQIEFYELSDDAYATSFYNTNKSIFESSKGNAATESNVELMIYSKYTLSSNGKYMVVSRIDNTVIYVNVDDSYRDTVKSILDELGY